MVKLDPADIFGSPDGLWFDPRGVLWIQTDDGAFEHRMQIAELDYVRDHPVIAERILLRRCEPSTQVPLHDYDWVDVVAKPHRADIV